MRRWGDVPAVIYTPVDFRYRSLFDHFKKGYPMNPLLIAAMTAITAALVLYSFGVFGERRGGTLRRRHVILFWCGFVCDTTGTTIMTFMAQAQSGAGSALHAISGVAAIALMLFHAVWATVVILRNDERWRKSFHRLSIVVWLFWLIPYIVGMLLGVPAFNVSDAGASIAGIAVVFVLGCIFCIQANHAKRVAGKRA